MNLNTHYQALQVVVRPSPETNDHEVRILADGVDLISQHWPDMMGMDPDDVLFEPCPLRSSATPSTVTIARCTCGVVGCGSTEVTIRTTGDRVIWDNPSVDGHVSLMRLSFLAKSYDAELARALLDHSWETPDRTAARLFSSKVSLAPLTVNHLSFLWASGRIRPRTFTVALHLEPGPHQVLVHVPWESESPHDIAMKAIGLLGMPPMQWPDVVWYPQGPDLMPPSIKGPGWRRAS